MRVSARSWCDSTPGPTLSLVARRISTTASIKSVTYCVETIVTKPRETGRRKIKDPAYAGLLGQISEKPDAFSAFSRYDT